MSLNLLQLLTHETQGAYQADIETLNRDILGVDDSPNLLFHS